MDKSILLFLFGCIPARTALALAPRFLPTDYLLFWAIPVLCMGLGFLFLFFTGGRKVGAETGGKPIWWTRFRLLHGFAYISSALYAFKNDAIMASNILLGDTAVGLSLSMAHHFAPQLGI